MPKQKESLTYISNSNNYLKCPYCNANFVGNNYKQIYCSREHKDKQQASDRKILRRRKTKSRKDRLTKKFNQLKKSSYGLYLFNQIRRSGTVEILRGFTSEMLHELNRIKRKATRYSAVKEGTPQEDYHLSHVFSAKGNETSIGTIHPENLVITPAKWNLKHKSIATEGTGRHILKSSLSPKWTVKTNDSPAEILGKARAYLGDEFNKFLSAVQLTNQREQLLKKLTGLTSIPATATLSMIKEIAVHHGISTFNKTSSAATVTEVLKHEIERLNKTDHWTYWLINQLHYECYFGIKIYALKELDTPSGYEDFIVEQALNWLHDCKVDIVFEGKPAPDYYAVPIECKEKITLLENELTPLDSFCMSMHRYQSSANLKCQEFASF
ncbi:hypothetical protein [Limnohabitans sp. TS-CS-82]|uniref:hypothetical protein n=1 Tax=Limnohabitans sp. TS-CS-82 TaxID=2094193 RepID=UPI0011B055A2|nr:hypothetical protein [Limnohabitans sp. TS-CS-82]